MPESLAVALIVLGGVLLLIALIGGGFKIFAAEVSGHAGGWARATSGAIGIVLILLGASGAGEKTEPSPPVAPVAIAGEMRSQPSDPTSAWVPAPAELRTDLMRAIKDADDLEREARWSGDTTKLSTVYGSSMVSEIGANIRELKQQGLRVDERLVGQDFRELLVTRDGMNAKVTVVETWENTVMKGSQCVAFIPAEPAPQTISLTKMGSRWLLTDVVHHSQSSSPGNCPAQH